MEDWSKLITVNFVGGFCGDFICSLAYNSYYNREIFLDDRVTKATHIPTNESLPCLIYDGETFKDFDLLTHIYYNHDLFQTLVDYNAHINKNFGFSELRYEQLSKIYLVCYDKDRDVFIKNVQEFCRSIIPGNLKDFVILPHTTSDNRIPEFYLSNMFPKSNNLTIVCSDDRFNKYFRLLGYHKFYGKLYNNDIKESMKIWNSFNSGLLSTFQRSYFKDLPGSNETKIYIDRFLFDYDASYIEEMEAIFSNIMNAEIKYDRNKIKNYRELNRSIMAKYLEIEPDFDHTNLENIKKINKFMNDIHGASQ